MWFALPIDPVPFLGPAVTAVDALLVWATLAAVAATALAAILRAAVGRRRAPQIARPAPAGRAGVAPRLGGSRAA